MDTIRALFLIFKKRQRGLPPLPPHSSCALELFYNFLTQTLHTFYKSSPSEYKFSDFPLLGLKFTKFLMPFSNKKSVFLQTLHHSSVSWDVTTWCNCFKNNMNLVIILIRALKSLQNLHFDWSLWFKVYNLWPKKVQRSYLSWHWIVM